MIKSGTQSATDACGKRVFRSSSSISSFPVVFLSFFSRATFIVVIIVVVVVVAFEANSCTFSQANWEQNGGMEQYNTRVSSGCLVEHTSLFVKGFIISIKQINLGKGVNIYKINHRSSRLRRRLPLRLRLRLPLPLVLGLLFPMLGKLLLLGP